MANNQELHVVFGSGPLGKSAARELVRLGKQVRVINRSGKAENLPAGVEVVSSDAYDAAKNITLTQGAAAIYQCAQPHYYEWLEKFPPLQKAIMEAARVNGAKMIVADNLYMYGHVDGALKEDSPVAPISKKGKVRAAMASEVLEAHASGKINAAIARGSNFFGPEDLTFSGYAIMPALKGKAVNLLGNPNLPHTFTYAPDFGRLIATLGVRPEALGQVWFTPSNAPISQNQFSDLLAAELGQPVKRMVAGKFMVGLLGLFIKEMKETVEMMYEWENPFVVDTSKAEKTFGLQPTPMKEAIRATVAWCRTQK